MLNQRGRRATALVLGDGLNFQAFAEAAPPRPAAWALAMKAVVADLNPTEQRRIARIPRYHHALFDELRAVRSDQWLGRRLCDELQEHAGAGSGLPLYYEIAAGDFEAF